jgi:hypothetical protein
MIHEYFSQAMLVFINFVCLHACGKKSGVTHPAIEIKCGPLRYLDISSFIIARERP